MLKSIVVLSLLQTLSLFKQYNLNQAVVAIIGYIIEFVEDTFSLDNWKTYFWIACKHFVLRVLGCVLQKFTNIYFSLLCYGFHHHMVCSHLESICNPACLHWDLFINSFYMKCKSMTNTQHFVRATRRKKTTQTSERTFQAFRNI